MRLLASRPYSSLSLSRNHLHITEKSLVYSAVEYARSHTSRLREHIDSSRDVHHALVFPLNLSGR